METHPLHSQHIVMINLGFVVQKLTAAFATNRSVVARSVVPALATMEEWLDPVAAALWEAVLVGTLYLVAGTQAVLGNRNMGDGPASKTMVVYTVVLETKGGLVVLQVVVAVVEDADVQQNWLTVERVMVNLRTIQKKLQDG